MLRRLRRRWHEWRAHEDAVRLGFVVPDDLSELDTENPEGATDG